MTVTCGGCVPRKYNHDSVVCVCNETYCDTWESVKAPESGSYAIWTTSCDGVRAQQSTGKFESQIKSEGKQHNVLVTSTVIMVIEFLPSI